MFENIGHWGPPVGGVPPHVILRWPDGYDIRIHTVGDYEWPDEDTFRLDDVPPGR